MLCGSKLGAEMIIGCESTYCPTTNAVLLLACAMLTHDKDRATLAVAHTP